MRTSKVAYKVSTHALPLAGVDATIIFAKKIPLSRNLSFVWLHPSLLSVLIGPLAVKNRFDTMLKKVSNNRVNWSFHEH